MILITQREIQTRISEIARQINSEYKGQEITFIGVLKGAYMFLSDLTRQITSDCVVDFITLESYLGTESSGTIKLKHNFTTDIKGRNVVIVEDILDTGLTLNHLLAHLSNYSPDTVKVAVLLDKLSENVLVGADYTGFTIPNKFVYGYGLDHNQKFRNLPDIHSL